MSKMIKITKVQIKKRRKLVYDPHPVRNKLRNIKSNLIELENYNLEPDIEYSIGIEIERDLETIDDYVSY